MKKYIKDRLRSIAHDPELQRRYDLLALNNKMLNYEAARARITDLRASAAKRRPHPGEVGLIGKIPTQSDIEANWYGYWCQVMRETPVYHRKIWEFAYALQVLSENGMLKPGKRALGFGCGTEPIASVLIAHGVEVTITDQAAATAGDGRWSTSGQHTSDIDAAFRSDIVDRATFERLAQFQVADMNDIVTSLRDYDFCWSLCAFEHLGSAAAGLNFVMASMRTLKPGGLALHTTELNASSSNETYETEVLVLYQERHFEELARRLEVEGHRMCERNYAPGDGLIDNLIDFPPYVLHAEHWLQPLRRMSDTSYDEPHLKLDIGGYPTTSFGFWVRSAV